MATTTRIKVSRETLLGKLRSERERLQAEYEKDEERYQVELGLFEGALAEAVDAFAELLAKDPEAALARVDSGYGGEKVIVRIPRLKKPSAPSLDTRQLVKMISILDAAADEFVSIAADDDYARYL